MANIEINFTKKSSSPKLIKKNTRVDLTPMVDLGFLLITFFVFTTTMAKPRAMNINLPFPTEPDDDVCVSCVLTLVPIADNQILYYEGAIDTASIKTTDYPSLRKLLQQKRNKVEQAVHDRDKMVLIIRPSEGSTMQNFVDISDEVIINAIKHYYIDDLTDAEKAKLHL